MMRYKSILEQEDYIMIDIKYGLPYLMSSSLPFLEKEQAS